MGGGGRGMERGEYVIMDYKRCEGKGGITRP